MIISEKKNLILFIILYLTPLTGIGVDLYAPSLPIIQESLNTNHALVKLTISIYLLGYGLGQPIFGTLSDSFGRKKILQIGLVFLILANLLAAISTNIYALLLARLIQGLAVAAPGVLAKSIATDCYSSAEMPKVSTYITMAWGLGPILAPVIGSYLLHQFGWQSNFYFLMFYSLVGLVLLYGFMQETNLQLIPLGFKIAFNSYKTVLTHAVFMLGLLGTTISYSMIIMFNIMGPFLIQNVLHYSPLAFGRIALLMGVAYFSGSMSNRVLIAYIKPSKVILTSFFLMIMFSLVMLLIANYGYLTLWAIMIPSFLIIYCVGLVFTNSMAVCISLFPHIAGTASAVMGCLFVVGTAVVSAIASLAKVQTQTPLALTYLVLSTLGWIAYCSMRLPWLIISPVYSNLHIIIVILHGLRNIFCFSLQSLLLLGLLALKKC